MIFTLGALFGDGALWRCADAADGNDDGAIDVADPVFTLGYLFSGGAMPRAPGAIDCGADPSPDNLHCDQSGCS